jgi:hypothetical protein
VARKSGKYGRNEVSLTGERLPPICLRWALHSLFVPGNRGLIDAIALQGVHEATQWQIDIRKDGKDVGSIAKATCQVAGCLAACRVIGVIRPEDGATLVADVYRNISEPGFAVCMRPPPEEAEELPEGD